MSREFTSTGKGSKAWWLKLIKEHGNEGGINALSIAGATTYHKAKPAIDLLFGGRYIDIMVGSRRLMPGESMQGKQPSYQLTTLGHRYLAENQDELEEAPVSEEARPEPVRHAVPDFGSPIGHHTTSQPKESAVQDTADPPKSVAGQPTLAADQSLVDAFKAVLSDILIERFADQVSAKDVLERMESKR